MIFAPFIARVAGLIGPGRYPREPALQNYSGIILALNKRRRALFLPDVAEPEIKKYRLELPVVPTSWASVDPESEYDYQPPDETESERSRSRRL